MVVLVFGMQAAQSILVPILLAAFVSILAVAPMNWMESKGVPHWASVTVIALVLLIVAMLGFLLVGASINQFSEQIPFYQRRLDEALGALLGRIESERFPTTVEELLDTVEPGAAMRFTASLLSGLGSLFANAFLILFAVVFMLLEAPHLSAKIRAVTGRPGAGTDAFVRFVGDLQRFLLIKTLVSVATGLAVGLWTAFLGLDFPLIWGLLAFALNYVPTIGSIIASIPAILLGFIQFGLGRAALVALGYLVINQILGTLIEPRIVGRRVGLSTLVVLLALIFWGWVFGPIGMLLSVPLTMTLKLGLQASRRTRWVATLLGDTVPATGIPAARP
jgi:predicted PurR-regulated permease PerM